MLICTLTLNLYLQGLIRFAMLATKAEDAPGNSQHGPMDEEVGS